MQESYYGRGILRESSYADTPQQNGWVKRKNRHILNVARALKSKQICLSNFGVNVHLP